MGLQASAGFVAPANFKNIVETDRNLIRSAFGSRPGVVGGSDFAITPAGSGLAVVAAAGRYVLRNRENEKQGFYHAWSDASETISWPAPSASPRIDTLIMRVADPQYGAVVGDPGGRWDIVQGVPSATPAARSDNEILTTFRVPGAWERIADVTVDPGATSFTAAKIADRRRRTASAGGLVVPTDLSVVGDYVDQVRVANGAMERWDGGKWHRMAVKGDFLTSIGRGGGQTVGGAETSVAAIGLTLPQAGPIFFQAAIRYGFSATRGITFRVRKDSVTGPSYSETGTVSGVAEANLSLAGMTPILPAGAHTFHLTANSDNSDTMTITPFAAHFWC